MEHRNPTGSRQYERQTALRRVLIGKERVGSAEMPTSHALRSSAFFQSIFAWARRRWRG